MEKENFIGAAARCFVAQKSPSFYHKAGMSIAIAGCQFAAAAVSVMPSSFFTSGAMSVSATSSK